MYLLLSHIPRGRFLATRKKLVDIRKYHLILVFRVFKLKKSSRRKLQSNRSTIGSLVEWG